MALKDLTFSLLLAIENPSSINWAVVHFVFQLADNLTRSDVFNHVLDSFSFRHSLEISFSKINLDDCIDKCSKKNLRTQNLKYTY